MKLRIFVVLVLCVILSGCTDSGTQPEQTAETVPAETTVGDTAAVVQPLPDTTMESLENSVVNISFNRDDFYREESGDVVLRMNVYSYDKFDMVDISVLEAGDTIVVSGEAIAVNSVERNDYGTVLVNGGLDEGGFDLATDDSGIYFVHGYSDMKSWYLVGEAEFKVSDTFVFTDSSDLDQGTATYYAEDILNGDSVPDLGYLPQNTTVRIEDGLVMEMNRVYTP